jgi:type I restriction enzyme S subunit
MEVKLGYKQTEVGVIPEEWDVTALGDIGHVIRGSSPRPKGDKRYYGGSVPRLMVEDVTRDRKYVTPCIDFLTVEGAKLSRPCKRGTLTVVCSGTPTVVGLPSILAVDACIHDGMLGLVRISGSAEPEYLFYRLTSLQEHLHASATHGGTFVNLTTTGFGDFRIALPSLPEQHAIATALSDVDGLLGGLDRLIAKKRDLKQAAMQQLLTGQTRLPGFTGEWEMKRLGDFGTTYGGLTGKTKSDFGDGTGRYITFMNVMSNVIINCQTFERVQVSALESQNRARKGDLFFNGSSETPEEVAMCAVLLDEVDDVYLNSFCFGFRFREAADADGLFFAYYLRSVEGRELMKSLAQGSTRYNLSKVALLNSTLRLPTRLEQTAISEVLTEMDAELTGLDQQRDKTRALKQAMMQELLTGRTRLV